MGGIHTGLFFCKLKLLLFDVHIRIEVSFCGHFEVTIVKSFLNMGKLSEDNLFIALAYVYISTVNIIVNNPLRWVDILLLSVPMSNIKHLFKKRLSREHTFWFLHLCFQISPRLNE